MPSFKDKLKKMASDKQIAAHPLVEKLNANQSTRSSYWLAFALYAKVEEQDLDAPLIELGKSLKLDESEIRDELSAVKECSSDEDFESLVQECASGLADAAAKILLAMELDQFSNKNSLDPDFISTLSDIIELSAEDRSFVDELKKYLKAKSPDMEKFYVFLNENADKPPVIFDLYCPELYKTATTIPEGAAEFLIKEIEKKRVSSNNAGDTLVHMMKPETLQVPEKMNDVDKKFKKQYPQTILSLTRNAAFQIYKTKIGEMFSQFEEWVNSLNSENESKGWPFDAVISRNLTLRWYFQYHMGVRSFELADSLFFGIAFGGEDPAKAMIDSFMGPLGACMGSRAREEYEEELRQRIKFRKDAIAKVRTFFDNELTEMEKHYS